MALYRMRIMVDTEVEADSMDEAIDSFCEDFNPWDELDCKEIED